MSPKVRAVKRGYAGDQLRRAGDVFTVADDQFAPSWMEVVPDDTRERRTSAQRALNDLHDQDAPLGRVRRIAEPVVDEDEDPGGCAQEWNPFTSK